MNEETRENFGEYLRRQREIRGFSLEEISEQTKISLRTLKALEAEDWEILPAEIYVRGFIRCYCETIGLDPNEALLRFEEVYAPYKKQREERRFTEEELPPSKKNPYWWPVVLVFLILAAFLGYFLFFHQKSPPSAQKASPQISVPSMKGSQGSTTGLPGGESLPEAQNSPEAKKGP